MKEVSMCNKCNRKMIPIGKAEYCPKCNTVREIKQR